MRQQVRQVRQTATDKESSLSERKLNECRMKWVKFESCHPDTQNYRGKRRLLFISAPMKSAPNYSMKSPEVKIRNRGKRGYLEFYITEGGKKKRQRRYAYSNREKDPKKRRKLLAELKLRISAELASGKMPSDSQMEPFEIHERMPISVFIDKVCADKKLFQKKWSAKETKSALKKFKLFLVRKRISHLLPAEISRQHISEFRNSVLQAGSKNRTANNNMIHVRALFNHLKENYELLEKNPCDGMKKLPTQSESHKVYSEEQIAELREYLTERDPQLLFFCKFIVYCFMRRNEIRHIKIEDLALKDGALRMASMSAKTNKVQTVFIPKIFLDELKRMKIEGKPSDYLFTIDRKPGKKICGQNYFTKHFRKVKKALGFGAGYSMYGLRHTFICHLKKRGMQDFEIMKYTRHKTLDAFQHYLQSIMSQRPKDSSKKYKMKF